jgi:hypothetical protein
MNYHFETQNFMMESMVLTMLVALISFILLKRNRFYGVHRTMLLFGVIAAQVFPLLSIPFWVKETATLVRKQSHHISEIAQVDSSTPLILYAYLFICILLIVRLSIRVLQGIILVKKGNRIGYENGTVIYINEDSQGPFSFMNTINLPIGYSAYHMQHELAHVRLKHSYDIIFMEILKAIFWYNVFLYLVSIRLKMIHEYQADEATIANENDKIEYSNFLLDTFKQQTSFTLSNNFYSNIKSRFTMLHNNQSSLKSKLIFIFSIVFLTGSFISTTLDAKVMRPTQPKLQKVVSTIDTLPPKYVEKQIIVYNPKTNKRDTLTTVDIQDVKPQNEPKLTLDDFFKKYGNKRVINIDTLSTFDYDTYVETVTIKKNEIPVALQKYISYLYKLGSYKMEVIDELYLKYGTPIKE